MHQISEQAKKSIIDKGLSKKGKELIELASLHNIGCSTLRTWISNYKSSMAGTANSHKSSSKIQFTPTERFQHLLATSTLDEIALGAYCREHGFYSFQLEQWKNEFMSKDENKKQQDQQVELKTLRAEIKLLKQDLLRKDRALAETTALLVLKKKADLIWGDPGED